jgi:transcriptional regulator with PAS, ATPase and Fis domain
LEVYNHKYSVSKELSLSSEQVLENYNWPGNVRELENLIERLVVTTSHNIIDTEDLPQFLIQNGSDLNSKIRIDEIMKLNEAQEIVEKLLIEKAYKKYRNTYEMAEVLGVNQSTVVRKIHKYIKTNALLHD